MSTQATCQTCGEKVDMTFHGECRSCAIDSNDYDDSGTDCANCGGEGFTYGCSWDWQCDTWDGDSCLCTRRCEWCNPPKLTPAEQEQRDQLRALLANALAPEGGHHD
ncbi:hypothetical protein [Novosphingobium sp. B1]|uniref:hypothetical protein n=1 Tax=Novosphingobium sp. B1 TaxID=1938756 RepID=UPI0009D90D7E|nr:hypothetical protein [Novosphingobium sp. B1]SMD03787.1 hypothetical protein SAMN06272759_1259 [Novosphingobium sp. B1]